MKIIIVGCGKVGFTLAQSLTNEKHNVILVDKNQEVLDNAVSSIDCMSVEGNGAIQSVLIEAQVETSDYLIACTSSDEINILTCLMARKSSKCRTIARIRNPEYAKQMGTYYNAVRAYNNDHPDSPISFDGNETPLPEPYS